MKYRLAVRLWWRLDRIKVFRDSSSISGFRKELHTNYDLDFVGLTEIFKRCHILQLLLVQS